MVNSSRRSLRGKSSRSRGDLRVILKELSVEKHILRDGKRRMGTINI